MFDNRIGSACWYRTYDYGVRDWSAWAAGSLKAWSTDHVESTAGFGPFPVGVVEDAKTMRCLSVNVSEICFAAEPPAA